MREDKQNQDEPDTVRSRVNNETDYAAIDAAARAWIEAGGDADGVDYHWFDIRDRVGELEQERIDQFRTDYAND